MAQIEKGVVRHLHRLEGADRQRPSLTRTTKTSHLTEKIAKLKKEVQRLLALEVGCSPHRTSRYR